MKRPGYWTSTIYSKLVAQLLGKEARFLDDRGNELGLTEDLAFLVTTLPEWESTYCHVRQALLKQLWFRPVPLVRYPEALAALEHLTLAWYIESFWEGLNEYEEDFDEVQGPLPKGFIVTIPPPPDRRAIAAKRALASTKALIYIVLVAIAGALGQVGKIVAHFLGQVLVVVLTPTVHEQRVRQGLDPPPHPPPLTFIPSTISPAAP